MSAPGTHTVRRAANVASGSVKRRLTPNKIALDGVPRLALPADIRRALKRENVQGVSEVALDYNMFTPTGRVELTLVKPNFMQDSLRALKKLTISGIEVTATQAEEETPPRQRGSEGRVEAFERGFPHHGTLAKIIGKESVKYVTVWGLPGKLRPTELEPLLTDYKVAIKKDGSRDLVKVQLPKGMFSMFSRFLVKLESEAEAHRLVRDFHNTPWQVANYQHPFMLYARKIY